MSIFGLRKDKYIMEITKQTKMGDMIEYDRGIAVVSYGGRYALRRLSCVYRRIS